MNDYFSNTLAGNSNIDKLNDLFYQIYITLYNKKHIHGEVLENTCFEISTTGGVCLLRTKASVFYEEVIKLLRGFDESDKEVAAKYFVQNLLGNNARYDGVPTAVKTLWIDCKNKSIESVSTLLNASGDNTNFIFEVKGGMDDEKMEHFNNIFKTTVRKGEICFDIATADRMQYLHQIGCDIQFVGTAKNGARTNLVKYGGMEMPAIVGGMLKKFYFENLSGSTSVEDCIEYLAENDIVGYGFDDLRETYRGKIAQFLLCTFTGMRLGSPWNGRQEVNGGYIVVKNNGDVVAFHSTIADEFKDFLVAKMRMESPSHSRHRDMVIYKDGDRYYLKLALQLRFTLSR